MTISKMWTTFQLSNGLKNQYLEIDDSNEIWIKFMKSLIQNVNILISVT